MKVQFARAVPMVLLISAISGCLDRPVLWSPDGRWLAYVSTVSPVESRLPAGWLFDTDEAPKGRPVVSGYRLWTVRPDGTSPVLIEESASPISSPGWSPDGSALAYAKIVEEGEGRSRYELIVREGLERSRVLVSLPLPRDVQHPEALPALAVAWSPDGRYLAAPTVEPRGLAIVSVDQGRIVKVLEEAYLPSWSPIGGRLAYLRGGEPPSLYCLDPSFGAPRLLTEIGYASQPVAWSRDGLSVYAVTRRAGAGTGRGPQVSADQADLIRVRVDENPPAPTPIRVLVPDAMTRGRTLEGIALTIDRDGDNAFYSPSIQGRENTISWCLPRVNQVYRQFHPVDISQKVGSLAISPNGKQLAMRLGPLEAQSPPLVFNLESSKSTLIAADDDARIEWIAILVASARSIVANPPVPPSDEGRAIARPSWLPVIGEFPPTSEAGLRLRKIGRLGRPLCDRPADAPPADAETLRALAEARLFFDDLSGDYQAAEASLNALEATLERSEERLKALGLRAQLYTARGEFEKARATLDYLKSAEVADPRRIETVGEQQVVTIEPVVGRTWPAYLLARVAAHERQLASGEAYRVENPLEAIPPGGRMPGFGPDPFEGDEFPRPGDGIPQIQPFDPMPMIEPDLPLIREAPPALPQIEPR